MASVNKVMLIGNLTRDPEVLGGGAWVEDALREAVDCTQEGPRDPWADRDQEYLGGEGRPCRDRRPWDPREAPGAGASLTET